MGCFLERVGIFFLHGFLGLSEDWNPVFEKIVKGTDRKLYAVHYFKENFLGPDEPLNKWGESFNEFALAKSHKRNIIVGYSLGARLAMQALEQSPSLWTHAVLISANVGFADADEKAREERTENDEKWAERFEAESWAAVLKQWNSQAVFAGSAKEPQRLEKDYQRSILSQALREWSLANQPDMRPLLKSQVKKITWLTGASDKKFNALADSLQKEIPGLRALKIPQASHRVLFDQPQSIVKIVEELLK